MNSFLKSEQYRGFELPEHFTFGEVQKYTRETIGDAPFEECVHEKITPYELSDVNLDILLNKDVQYVVLQRQRVRDYTKVYV